jgi:NAD(P)H dehydrogenase (quinone)
MKTIITGASGDYGQKSAELVLEKLSPSDLILTTRTPAKLSSLSDRGVSVRYCDFDKPYSIEAAFEGGERMLLISTIQVGRREPQHRAAIEAAKKTGIKRIVYTSFVGLDPNNPAMVAGEHIATEKMLKESGMTYTILRDSQYAEALVMYGAPRFAQHGKWTSSAGDGKIALISHNDCVECGVAALLGEGHENKIYNITGPELLSYRDMAAMTERISGKPVEYEVVSDDEMFAMFDAIGVPREYVEGMDIEGAGRWQSNDMVSFERAIREGYFAVISDDAKKLLGREPKTVWQVFLDHKDLFQ